VSSDFTAESAAELDMVKNQWLGDLQKTPPNFLFKTQEDILDLFHNSDRRNFLVECIDCVASTPLSIQGQLANIQQLVFISASFSNISANNHICLSHTGIIYGVIYFLLLLIFFYMPLAGLYGNIYRFCDTFLNNLFNKISS
jgi:hypothetical protein